MAQIHCGCRIGKAVLALALTVSLLVFLQVQAGLAETLPLPEPKFKGKIGKTYKDSVPDFPKPLQAPKDAPNVLLIILDDVGFGHAGTFGGPIPTPTLDRLAANGLRYNQFHTTALCSPTRAALLTGRNHHSVGVGNIMEFGTGFPGYNSIMPKSAATVAEILKQHGFNTAAFGKWHMTPDWETSPAGPFDRWPTGQGFEYFYGFLPAESNQFYPALTENLNHIPPPATPEEGYILNKDLADKAVKWIRYQHSVAPAKPFFIYYAPGACHAPHHAPKDWIAKFKGKFDQGWDKVREETFERQKKLGVIPPSTQLTSRPPEIPAWEPLSPDQKRVFARMQEAYAAYLAHTDHEIGRVIGAIDQLGRLDNTLVIYIVGDNGPSAEGTLQGTLNEVAAAGNGIIEPLEVLLKRIDEIGGPNTVGHYPVGWAWAGSSPLKWVKQVASHFGGVRNPMVISWPKGIQEKDGLRPQFHHAIDVVPTILEAAGIPAPTMVNGVKQKPMEGVSLAYTFSPGQARAKSRHLTQYFEMFGNRGIYHDGWMASTRHGRLPWQTVGHGTGDFDDDKWELYNVQEDFSQANDLAAQHPQKLKQLQALFMGEAKKYNVLPLDDRFAERAIAARPSLTAGRNSLTYYPGAVRLPGACSPNLLNKSYSITAQVDNPDGKAEGMLATYGGKFGGYGFFIQNGKPTFVYNWGDSARYTITSAEPLPQGKSTVRFDFAYDGGKMGAGGAGAIFINDRKVAEGRIDRTVMVGFTFDETFDVGEDTGTPVGDYKIPFRFTGKLEKLTFDLKP
ncbi:MAG: arylsulfatase [Deltaproteobacteria bacterium]|nr:arylsulfatase [Deltaproteobacteria bacterium]